jgi:cell division protein FtsW
MAVGVGFFAIGLMVPYRFWQKFSLPMLIFSIGLLALVFTSVGSDYGTARSWLNIGFLPSLQPVELAKLSLVCYFATWLEKRRHELKSFQFGFLPFSTILATLVLLLALQPDFGSILVVTVTAAAIFYAAGGNTLHLLGGGALAGFLGMFVILNNKYIYNRFAAFIDPSVDPLGIGYQIQNALTAIGSGGAFGVGFGQSVQKSGYLPEVQADTIFSAIAEELGFVRVLILVGAFLVIAWRGYSIADNTSDRFAKLMVVGITSWITAQAFINIGVNLSLLPNTGITLPFISYGGSSLIASLLSVGIVLNISRGVSAPMRQSGQRSVRTRARRIAKTGVRVHY